MYLNHQKDIFTHSRAWLTPTHWKWKCQVAFHFKLWDIFKHFYPLNLKHEAYTLSWQFISTVCLFLGCQFDTFIRRREDSVQCEPSQLEVNIYLFHVNIRTLTLINSPIRSFGCWSNKLLFHPCLPFVFYWEERREDGEKVERRREEERNLFGRSLMRRIFFFFCQYYFISWVSSVEVWTRFVPKSTLCQV